jgi:hypothetical protein
LERTLQQVKEKLEDPAFRVFLRQLESLGAIRDMTRYGVQAWEHYFTRWDHNLRLLQSETSPRETTFPTNMDYQFDGKKHKELLRGATGEGLEYGNHQAAILSESRATLPTSVQVIDQITVKHNSTLDRPLPIKSV